MTILEDALILEPFAARYSEKGITPGGRIERIFDYTPPTAGIQVTEATALNYAAVWRAVSVIAQTLAGLPWRLFRVDGERRELQAKNPIDRLIHLQPNPEMSSLQFRETLQSHVLLWGNGYAEIERTRSGRPVALWPLSPDKVSPDREDGRLVYKHRVGPGEPDVLESEQVFHVRGLSWDGLRGYSPIAIARESISMGLAAERFGAAFYGNDARPSVVFTHPRALKDQAIKRMKQSVKSAYGGAAQSWSPMILEEGMEVKTITMPPEDAQFLETRQFQIVEVARWFGVQPHKLMDLNNAHFNNIEHQSIEFVTDTMLPWILRWEQEANWKLLTDSQMETKFNVNARLRGDQTTRANFYQGMSRIGVMSINEIRRLEDMEPIENGDLRTIQANMVTLDDAASEQPTAPPAVGPPQNQIEEAYHQLLLDDLSPLLAVEQKSIQKAARKHAGDPLAFSEWATYQYGKQAQTTLAAILTTLRTYATLTGYVLDEERATAFVCQRCESYRDAIVAANEVGMLADVLGSWAQDRPEADVTQIMGELPDWRVR